MNTYDILRHFADSWGLLAMAAMFVAFVGWTFRAGANHHHDVAAQMIFKEDDNGQAD
jgi:cytochrome c oxidase cbb3-type subunit IV